MPQENPSVDTVVTSKPALVTDLNSSYVNKEQYTHARNAVRASRDGDLGSIGNEPSNELCFSAPYKIVGTVYLPDDTVMVCSGDGKNSEIGIGNLKDCSYKTLKNMQCFNFSEDFPVKGVAKKDFKKGIIVTFVDKHNPDRRVVLNKLKDIKSCDEILLFKKINHPCLQVKKGQIGNMPNGVYSVVISYTVDNERFSDWYSISNRIMLNSKNMSNSLEIDVSGLDQDFEQFTIGVVGNYIDPTTKGATKVAKKIGTYSTKVKKVEVTDFLNSNYEDIKLSELIVQKRTWLKSGIIAANSNHLMLADLVGRDEENYQLKAMQIESEYVVTQVEADYYEQDGQDIGYYRDENYDFYIQGVYTTGELTDKFHIPGPKATQADRAIVSSVDVYEYDTQFKDCVEPGKIEKWQVENTAGRLIPENEEFFCNRRVYGHGKLGVFESTELYPDNKAMFGEDAGKPQRFHKMPDEAKVPRYSEVNNKYYINILGVRFKKIPKFDNPDIVGYKITRSDRKGGNGTVVARGLMTNIRFYDDISAKERIMFSNYPINDLSPDQYLSSTQTKFSSGSEKSFNPISGYYKDRFTFYSPHTLFEPRYTLGQEIKIEAEEVATVTGQFQTVHNHPKAKLLNQFAFWISATVGFIEASLVLLGKTNVDTLAGMKLFGLDAGAYAEITAHHKIETVADLVALSPGQLFDMISTAAKALDPSKVSTIAKFLKAIIQSILSLSIKIPYSLLSGMIEANKTLESIYDLTGYTDYVYQYNAYAKFRKSIASKQGNKRRRLSRSYQYLPSDVVSINGETYNNYFREKAVYLELNKPIADPITKDNSRNTISGFGICGKIDAKVGSTGSAFYATSKVVNPNQYGRIGSANPVAMHSCVYEFDGEESKTPVLFGGDCIITSFQFQKRMQFFSQNMANTNWPAGTEYDYRMYRNIGYPRFWMDTTQYDFSSVVTREVVNYTKFSRTTTSKYNLDCKKGNDGKSITRIDDAYMYLSNNAVLDFFVECDYNIAFREETDKPFYSKENSNLGQIFRSDRLDTPEEFKINRVYSDLYTTEIFAQQQRDDFDPANPIPVVQPNSVIYSLPSFNLQEVDNWQYFLPANFFNFKESDFGNLTAIHQMDQDRLIFLFSKASPYISMGRSVLQLSNQTVTIGDGGIFAQDPREMMPTDNNYASCNSRFAFSNTHMGRFYPSESQGRIISAEQLDDITRQGISYWCKNYMPIQLYEHFPSYPELENPVAGVGYLMAFDSFNETVYICKRDFVPKDEYKYSIQWDNEAKSFKFDGKKIKQRDPKYFDDISWTLSYSPLDKSFISWHDWHPDWIIQTDNHFMSVKDNTVWKHNERYDSFCNFYGIDYPFEIEFLSSSGQSVETIRSLEYILEVYKYKNSGRDRFHVHHENFDRLIVWNTEQISPLLNLHYANPNPMENLMYPKRNPSTKVGYDIAYFKEENKYRVNQFWDTTKDRGEFSKSEFHLFPTDQSGYRNVINTLGIDINRPEEQRKKFRHYFNKFRFTKTVSGENKFLVKIFNIKKQLSIR